MFQTLLLVFLGSEEPEGKSQFLRVLSQISGWVYFFAWSLSFYPQVWINFRRKSVTGLSFDFLGLNISGYICYSLFNCMMFWSKEIHREYFAKYPTAKFSIPVEINDVVFALHGFCLTAITIFQCIIYERGNQKVSKATIIVSIIGWTSAIIVLIITIFGKTNWLFLIYWFSYMKLFVTATKYTPQVYMNWKRKCTQGWSIGNVLLDLSGGVLSFVQMFIDSINTGDWNVYFGNPVKMLLSVLTLCYDSIFVVQHYCLYHGKKSKEPEKPSSSSQPNSPINEESTVGEQRPLLSVPKMDD